MRAAEQVSTIQLNQCHCQFDVVCSDSNHSTYFNTNNIFNSILNNHPLFFTDGRICFSSDAASQLTFCVRNAGTEPKKEKNWNGSAKEMSTMRQDSQTYLSCSWSSFSSQLKHNGVVSEHEFCGKICTANVTNRGKKIIFFIFLYYRNKQMTVSTITKPIAQI